MRVLVTGITGFVGSHFAEVALAQGAEVFGACRSTSSKENIAHLAGRVQLVEADLRDMASVQRLLAVSRPDFVVNLAAQSRVGESWQAPAETLITNTLIPVNLLEGVRIQAVKPRVLVIGSSEEYGQVEEHELPIKETNALRPLSPYAMSKVTQDLMGYQYFKSYGLPIVRSRAFNHEGPRRGDVFVTSNFSRQIAEIEAGRRPRVIHVGNLKARRDYTDVRDVVRAYWRLLEAGEAGEVYNVCSGNGWLIGDVLDFLISLSRVRGIRVQEDPARLRPFDVPVVVGDYRRIQRAVGWAPEVPFERTLRDILDYWRQRLGGGAGAVS
jgi:GDP-4-dehydro-6-deoxy-D-mannose reductase